MAELLFELIFAGIGFSQSEERKSAYFTLPETHLNPMR